jgi:uncharacterized peroxidase-related enzyme
VPKRKTAAEMRPDPVKRASAPTRRKARRAAAGGAGADDYTRITALRLKPAKLTPDMAAYFKLCDDKLGFVPNVLKAFAFDMAKLEAFVAYRNDLMQGESGLSKLEREMIATAVSAHNRCYYCITAHGASVRVLSGDPVLGERIVMNYRAARLNRRQRAMLDFAVRLTAEPWLVEDADREGLRRAGFSDRDIWGVFCSMGNVPRIHWTRLHSFSC